MPMGTNPLASVMGVGGAAGDLGLSTAVSKEAADTAEAIRRKKQKEMDAQRAGAPAAQPSAMSDILNGFL